MKPGFTLVELMAVLLLTGILLASLFLFTFYFWKNHVDQMQYLQFTDQKQVFLDWLHTQLRNSTEMDIRNNQIILDMTNGTETTVTLTSDGPVYGEIAFFNQPTEVLVTPEGDTSLMVHLKLVFVQGRWTQNEQLWVRLNPVPSYVQAGQP